VRIRHVLDRDLADRLLTSPCLWGTALAAPVLLHRPSSTACAGNINGATAVSWLSLTKATTLLDHDAQRARESLGRAISKAWIVGPGGSPAPAIDPNVPLRVQVTPSPGRRLVGRDWLEWPVLHWETSEIECLCTPWMPPRASQPAPPSQSRARIEIWREDIGRLWGAPESFDGNVPTTSSESTFGEFIQEEGSPSAAPASDPNDQ
jgi:hypothetical protein